LETAASKLLSTHYSLNFQKPCTHGCVGNGVPPKDMNELLGRKPKAADYISLCELCVDPNAAGNVLMCAHCNAEAHPHCMERKHWDHGTGDVAWTCVRCVKDLDEVN
jgi:hypothetical protein